MPKEVLELPKLGCINVHASLLPKLRGASPIQQAIVSGETETGVTIMQMAEGLDTGDMLAKVSLPIGSMNGGELHDALAEAGAKLLVATLPRLAAGDITPEPQDDSRASYAGMIRKQDGHIDFTKTPEEIERLIRGFSPWAGRILRGKRQGHQILGRQSRWMKRRMLRRVRCWRRTTRVFASAAAGACFW